MFQLLYYIFIVNFLHMYITFYSLLFFLYSFLILYSLLLLFIFVL